MIDIDAISELLPILKANGVSTFKSKDFELLFHVEQSVTNAPSQLIDDKQAEASLPPDLRTDSINSFDSLMNWSAPPSADTKELELPLTGDAPL